MQETAPDPTQPVPRKRSIRRSLILANIFLIGTALLVCAVGIYVALYRPLLRDLAVSNMTLSANRVMAEVETMFARVAGIAASEREWGARGLIDLDHLDAINALFYPVLDGTSGITSYAVADENG